MNESVLDKKIEQVLIVPLTSSPAKFFFTTGIEWRGYNNNSSQTRLRKTENVG
jgi:hypothetical protein